MIDNNVPASGRPAKSLWLLTTMWSAGLFVLSFVSICVAGLLLFVLSLLVGTPLLPLAFRFGILLQPVVWGVGTVASCRIHRSYRLAVALVATGLVAFVAVPFVLYFVVLFIGGGWQAGH